MELGTCVYIHCFHIPSQTDKQATHALSSTEKEESAPSSFQNAVISYLSRDVKSVCKVFPEDQSMWSVLLIFLSLPTPLKCQKRCVPITSSFPSPTGDLRSLLRVLSVKSYLTILGSYLQTLSQKVKSLGGMNRNNDLTKDDPRKFWLLNSMLWMSLVFEIVFLPRTPILPELLGMNYRNHNFGFYGQNFILDSGIGITLQSINHTKERPIMYFFIYVSFN